MKTEAALSRHETLGNKAGASFVRPGEFEIGQANAVANITSLDRYTIFL